MLDDNKMQHEGWNEAQFYEDMGQLIWEILEDDDDVMLRIEEDEKALEEAKAKE